jgi:trans-aconitate 2-methyltransferase
MKWNPADYARSSDAQLKWAQELQANLNLSAYESILDVGCGDGKISANFARLVPDGRVVAIDSSPEMIEYAIDTYPSSQYPNLSFACMAAQSLTFEQEFDLIFSNAALHWVDDHPAFLTGARRAFRNGGRLIISCGGAGNAIDVLQVFSELVVSNPWQQYFEGFANPYFFYDSSVYRKWLLAAGLTVNRVELIPKDMIHRSREEFTAWIRTAWLPFTSKVPVDEQAQFIEEFVDRYLALIPIDDQGCTHIKMVRLEVDANCYPKQNHLA